MRPALRPALVAATLLLGLPAAALVVAHLGFIALPVDPLARTEPGTAGTTASGSGVGMRALERLDTMPRHRVLLAQIAIVAAERRLPGHLDGIERRWVFQPASREGTRAARGEDLAAMVVVPDCTECVHGRDARLVVRARVENTNGRARVTLNWVLSSGSATTYARYEGANAAREERRGRITVELRLEDGVWVAAVPD